MKTVNVHECDANKPCRDMMDNLASALNESEKRNGCEKVFVTVKYLNEELSMDHILMVSNFCN